MSWKVGEAGGAWLALKSDEPAGGKSSLDWYEEASKPNVPCALLGGVCVVIEYPKSVASPRPSACAGGGKREMLGDVARYKRFKGTYQKVTSESW